MTTLTDPALSRMHDERLVAVVRASSATDAVRAGEALGAGGVRALEIAFTTPDAAEAIARLSEREELHVGAGTVCSAVQARDAIAAGARFLVSPGRSDAVLDVAERAEVLAIPGALTPTEVMALADRTQIIKLFPAGLGGIAYLKALRGPFPDLRVVPTGGVDAGNAADWLAAGAFAVGAGGDLCPPRLIAAGDVDGITAIARRYREAVDRVEEPAA